MADDAQIEAIRRLLQLAERFQLAELEVEEDGLRVTVRAGHLPDGAAGRESAAVDDGPAPAGAAPAGAGLAEYPHPERVHLVISPITGNFYRAPAPDQPPYAEEGMEVAAGQPIGVLEAMKVFSDVPADRDGILLGFKAFNGQLVHEGDPLAVIELPE